MPIFGDLPVMNPQFEDRHAVNDRVEKMGVMEVEDVAVSEKGGASRGDYSGAVAKSDPREIALVKKLDYRIMPTLFCMYFL